MAIMQVVDQMEGIWVPCSIVATDESDEETSADSFREVSINVGC